MSETLRSCPFCGGEAEFVTDIGAALITCNNCNCGTDWLYTKEEAIEAWNTRHVDSLPTEEEARKYANGYFGYPEDTDSCVDAQESAFVSGAEWAIEQFKSRLAGKGE